MTVLTRLVVVAGLLLSIGCSGVREESSNQPETVAPPAMPEPRTMVLETKVMPIDKIYPSMLGPYDALMVDHAELDWVVSMRTDVVDAETTDLMGGEFFCHSQLGIPQSQYRMFVLATGMDEVRFPAGFGLRVGDAVRKAASNGQASLGFLGMVLNNHEVEIDRQAMVRATLEYYRESDLGDAIHLTALRNRALTMQVEDLRDYVPEEGANTDVSTHCALVPQGDGVERSIHWVVPPGRQVTRFEFPFALTAKDATVHFATAHLHNYGVYMSLTDVTTGEVVWRTDAQYEKDRHQINRIPVYSSETGFLVHQDHRYQIEAVYENTTDHDVDAMAMMNIYYAHIDDASTM